MLLKLLQKDQLKKYQKNNNKKSNKFVSQKIISLLDGKTNKISKFRIKNQK